MIWAGQYPYACMSFRRWVFGETVEELEVKVGKGMIRSE
jgi:hypothetical protein